MLKKTKREVLIILAKQINANTKMADFFKSGRLLTKKQQTPYKSSRTYSPTAIQSIQKTAFVKKAENISCFLHFFR